MLKLYLPKLRILVFSLKSIVNSHATIIMTIGNIHQGLFNAVLISKVILQVHDSYLFCNTSSEIFVVLHHFTLGSVESTKKQL